MPRPIGDVDPALLATVGDAIGPPGPPGAGVGGGVPAGTQYAMSVEGGETGQMTVQSVAVTPGWTVVDAFNYDENEHLVVPPGILTRVFFATVIASQPALQVRIKMVRADTLVDVAGSLLTFAPPVSAQEVSQETADLTGVLVDGIEYQIQAECTGGALATDYVSVRSAGLRAIFTY
jgi:hypothetical protein